MHQKDRGRCLIIKRSEIRRPQNSAPMKQRTNWHRKPRSIARYILSPFLQQNESLTKESYHPLQDTLQSASAVCWRSRPYRIAFVSSNICCAYHLLFLWNQGPRWWRVNERWQKVFNPNTHINLYNYKCIKNSLAEIDGSLRCAPRQPTKELNKKKKKKKNREWPPKCADVSSTVSFENERSLKSHTVDLTIP